MRNPGPLFLISAGETSGDILGASLMAKIRHMVPNCRFAGIGGSLMSQQRIECVLQSNQDSTVGFEGLMAEIPRVLKRWKQMRQYAQKHRPCLFIGVDLPDFNLPLAARMRKLDIPTVQYVSPTIWAWRKWRIHKIRKNIDLMLLIFPFEKDIYDRYHVENLFMGHPAALRISKRKDSDKALKKLNLSNKKTWIAVLPGSRTIELKHHLKIFMQACEKFNHLYPETAFILPLANAAHRPLVEQALPRGVPLEVLSPGHSIEAIEAAHCALLSSGTAALEAALVGKPMVMTYKISQMSYLVARMLVHGQKKGLCAPNFLAQKPYVPELIQSNVTVPNIIHELEKVCFDVSVRNRMNQEFAKLHPLLKLNLTSRHQVDEKLKHFIEQCITKAESKHAYPS